MGILDGKVALVTGAASGIGRAVAETYIREGAKVAVSDIDDEEGREFTEALVAAGGEAIYVHCNSADPDDNRKLVEAAVEKWGALHVACNNAGIGGETNATADYSIDGWKKVVDINLNGVFYGMRYQIPAMLTAGEGAIVNMASILGQVGWATSPAYAAAKHGVVGLTKTAGAEYAPQGVRINAVGPGYIDTPLLENLDPEVYAGLEELHPIGRLGQAEEVAELVTFLSSPKASFIAASYYPVDGGFLSR